MIPPPKRYLYPSYKVKVKELELENMRLAHELSKVRDELAAANIELKAHAEQIANGSGRGV